jgi:hypothetical protein
VGGERPEDRLSGEVVQTSSEAQGCWAVSEVADCSMREQAGDACSGGGGEERGIIYC